MMSEKCPSKWVEEGKKAFEDIKASISLAPLLVSLDFKKDFIMCYYASKHTLSCILTQKNDQDKEASIAFMSISLKKHELNYSHIEKHTFAIVKVVK